MDVIKVRCTECNSEFEVCEDEVDKELMAHGAVFDSDYTYSRNQYVDCPVCGALNEIAWEDVDWDELADDEQSEMLMYGLVSEEVYRSYCDDYLGGF